MSKTAARISTALVLVGLAFAPSAIAGKGGGNGGGPKAGGAAPLTLFSERVWNSPNPNAPSWCLNEDDWHQRIWSGSLNGSFSTSEQLCGTSGDYAGGIWWDAGAVGLQADLYVTGALTGFTMTSPSGDSRHALLVDSSTSKGATTQHYQVCSLPPYSIASKAGGTPLTGGTWQLTLSGSIKNASLTLTAQMADTAFQQRCPAPHQNLVP